MIDLKKLLVCEGKPSQYMIDYKVDAAVKNMVDKYMFEDDKFVNRDYFFNELFDTNKKAGLSDKSLRIYTQAQYFDDVVESVQKSLERYSPFLQLDPYFSKELSAQKYDKLDRGNAKPEKIIHIDFRIDLEITPEMKKMMLLDDELAVKNELTARKPKI